MFCTQKWFQYLYYNKKPPVPCEINWGLNGCVITKICVFLLNNNNTFITLTSIYLTTCWNLQHGRYHTVKYWRARTWPFRLVNSSAFVASLVEGTSSQWGCHVEAQFTMHCRDASLIIMVTSALLQFPSPHPALTCPTILPGVWKTQSNEGVDCAIHAV